MKYWLLLLRTFKMMAYNSPPVGIRFMTYIGSKVFPGVHFNRVLLYKISIFVLTYAAYATFHMTRKILSAVKPILHQNCSSIPRPVDASNYYPSLGTNDDTWCDYPPFDGDDIHAKALLGWLDSAFLFTYAICMFISGFIAERVSIRYYLSIGMLLSGIFCYLFGMGKVYEIHNIGYFIVMQILAGMFQTTGWPGVVTLVGRWFGKAKRGLLFGIWNSHTSIGNILGSIIAGYYVEKDWSMSFIVPGFVMGIVGFIVFLFVVDSPSHVGVQIDSSDRRRVQHPETGSSETDSLLSATEASVNFYDERRSSNSRTDDDQTEGNAVGLLGALKIPGVVEFSLCLFFSKLVNYTFLYWLPLYIQHSTSYGPKYSADLSTVFDLGGIIGAILAGLISDYSGKNATTCVSMLFFTGPLLYIYLAVQSASLFKSVLILLVLGIFVNGPYALITTTVSAELGQHSSLEGNSKALATVTAIIDGTGSIGAAIGPLLAGMMTDWNYTFYLMIVSVFISMFCLSRLFLKEIRGPGRRNVRIE